MEKQFIKELAAQVVAAALNEQTLPIKSNPDYSWQDFALVSDADAESLSEHGITISGTIYSSGNVQINLSIPTNLKSRKSLQDAFNRLKAKNLVLMAIEKAEESKAAEFSSSELLKQAAEALGVTPEEALEMVNKSEAKQ